MGLGCLHGAVAVSTTAVPTANASGFAAPTAEGHGGTVRSLTIGGHRTLVFLGRTHLYEGRGTAAVAHGVRVAAAAGCRTVVLTNAAGGLRHGMRAGQPVLISDHLNLTARSPLVGARFVDCARRLIGLGNDDDDDQAQRLELERLL